MGIYQRREGEGVKIHIDTLGSSFLIIMLKISASAFSSTLIADCMGSKKRIIPMIYVPAFSFILSSWLSQLAILRLIFSWNVAYIEAIARFLDSI